MGDNHRPVSREHRPCIVPLGGFLGAGKTSLILAAARLLHARDVRAAAILNDQGADLVDTHFAQANGVRADQVAGGCFCCRFSELMDAAERLSSDSPDVIFIEAVGSCTDISATVLQPLKLEFAGRFRLAPYTVLIDPERAREWLEPGEESDLAFLFRKQIEEADLACFTKSDIHASFPPLAAGVPVRYLSSHTGQGVAEWLDEILAGRFPAARILDLDYDRYARAEASLAWLNCAATARLATPLSPAMVVGPLLEALDAALAAEGLAIAHLKVMDESPSGWLQASVVRKRRRTRRAGNAGRIARRRSPSAPERARGRGTRRSPPHCRDAARQSPWPRPGAGHPVLQPVAPQTGAASELRRQRTRLSRCRSCYEPTESANATAAFTR